MAAWFGYVVGWVEIFLFAVAHANDWPSSDDNDDDDDDKDVSVCVCVWIFLF